MSICVRHWLVPLFHCLVRGTAEQPCGSYGGFEASHVSVGRKRLLCEARRHFMLPTVA